MTQPGPPATALEQRKRSPDAPVWGQVVVGPPGAGKTTYCAGMQQFLTLAGRRVAVINLDPANDAVLPYTPAVDIGELVSLEGVQQELGLGPNGGLVYCLEYLEQNLDWLAERLAPLEAEGCYLLFDLPGQVELFTLHSSLRRILEVLTRRWQYRLTTVQLVDAHLCSDPAKYLSALLLSLSTMLHLELPQVNVLSKMDLIQQYGELAFSLDFYLQAQGLSHLAEAMEGSFPPRFRRMTEELCEVIEDFGLLSFQPLAIEDRDSVRHLVASIDKSNGFVFAGLAKAGQPAPEMQYSAGLTEDSSDLWDQMRERYIDRDLQVQERQPCVVGLQQEPQAGAAEVQEPQQAKQQAQQAQPTLDQQQQHQQPATAEEMQQQQRGAGL
ncbi:hypothetical protein D9Q98_008759 [Chlorella vulgaris]|uniref:GPN-loop GTPase 2 n=1 Tax=Chlorella vulgaris TaxID=3077 RepID=A0A9D4YU14_CHLVU|nr:hypothetical protein D9Q98_008759 [Chlorella vulgaris]